MSASVTLGLNAMSGGGTPVETGVALSVSEVSFVVIAYNEAPVIRQCVESLISQQRHLNEVYAVEIIVVDDASTDGTGDCIADLVATGQVRLVRHPTNAGRGAARATGVAAASGEFIAMVDADIVLPRHWLRTCLEWLNTTPHCVAVGGIAVPDGDVSWIARVSDLPPKAVHGTIPVTGNNGLYRKHVLQDFPFSPQYREGEDVALQLQLASAGLRSDCLSSLLVTHLEHKSYGQTLKWLFQSGLGASRQLQDSKSVRMVDVAALAFWSSVGVALVRAPKRGGVLRLLLPASLLQIMSGLHLARRFHLFGRGPWVAAGAVTSYSGIIGSYFVGRLVGHQRYLSQRLSRAR